jgi:hypothetical protein
MLEMVESRREEIGYIEEWVKKVAQNEPTSPQELLHESLTMRDQAMTVYENLVSLSKETGELEAPFTVAFEELIMSNELETRERILRLVYEGVVDPMEYHESFVDFIEMARDVSSVDYVFPRWEEGDWGEQKASCLACGACLACVACAACLVSGAIATGATGAAGATASVG